MSCDPPEQDVRTRQPHRHLGLDSTLVKECIMLARSSNSAVGEMCLFAVDRDLER